MEAFQVILLIGVVVFLFVIIRKRKKAKQKNIISNRKNKDEVWKTIKEYLRTNNKQGMEIVDCFSSKRNPDDYVDPHLSSFLRKQQKSIIDIRKWQSKLDNKKAMIAPPVPNKEVYVICFQTRNNKTNEFNPPEAFECEVTRTRVTKADTKQNIVVGRTLNFNNEMEWIAPIRAYELRRNEQNNKRAEKIALQNKYVDLIKAEKKIVKDLRKSKLLYAK